MCLHRLPTYRQRHRNELHPFFSSSKSEFDSFFQDFKVVYTEVMILYQIWQNIHTKGCIRQTLESIWPGQRSARIKATNFHSLELSASRVLETQKFKMALWLPVWLKFCEQCPCFRKEVNKSQSCFIICANWAACMDYSRSVDLVVLKCIIGVKFMSDALSNASFLIKTDFLNFKTHLFPWGQVRF